MFLLTPEWIRIISAFGLGSVITFFLGWLREWWTNKSQKKSEATYLAMAHFCAKWDEQMSVNYVSGPGD
jgi:hypothetical protein